MLEWNYRHYNVVNMLDMPLLLGSCVFLFTVLEHIVGLSAQNTFPANNLTIKRNSRFVTSDTFVLNSFVDASYDDCLWECGSRPRCKAVEYRFSARSCSIRSAESATVSSPGFLTVTGFNETNVCGGVECNSHGYCDPHTNTCIVKECGYPPTGSTFKGNRYEVGSRLMYESSEIAESRICLENGKWESDRTVEGITCRDIRQNHTNDVRSGYFRNRLNITIYCDFDRDGGDWMVVQYRTDGSVDFYRGWEEYKTGFGDVLGEFWLGLENLYTILNTTDAQYELRVDLEDWDGDTAFAVYDNFTISGESDGYRLHVGGYNGTAGDSLSVQNDQRFTTYDRDNDVRESLNCAIQYHGAWWYRKCHSSNLNGRYYVGGNTLSFATGVVWTTWHQYYYSIRKTTMKIREKK